MFILQVFWPRTSSEKSRLLDAAQIKMRRSNGIWRGDVMMAKSKFLSWLVLLTMIFTFLPVMTPAVQAGAGGDSVCTAVYVDDGNIVIDKDGISVGGMYMGFGPDGYIITQRDSVRETVYTITVEENVDTNITLCGININTTTASPFAIKSNARVNLILEKGTNNILRSDDGSDVPETNGFAALQMAADSELVIDGQGTLTATGGDYCAAIGGGKGENGGTITIEGGIINAQGGYSGAGIGGGEGGDGGTITINGGTVEAVGGNRGGAGIGGGGIGYESTGSGGNGGTIIITNGNVTAVGAFWGAGIGGGYGNNGGTIHISGGEISVTGGSTAAGIGGGGASGGDSMVDLSGGDITISGGKVVATGGFHGAGIGGGGDNQSDLICGSGGRITIYSGDIIATGGPYGAGIGGGRRADGGEITITGGTVQAVGGGVTVAFLGEGVYVIRGGGGAGIGGGGTSQSILPGGPGGEITISGGTVTAIAGYYAAGIGGGRSAHGGDITLNGGTVTATGGTVGFKYDGTRNTGGGGAGIGGGGAYTPEHIGGSGGNVTVTNDPAITAIGNDGGEHIGKGYNGVDSGSLQDGAGNDLSYLLFKVTGRSGAAVSDASVTVNNHTHITNSDGLTGCVVPRGSEVTYSVTAAGYNQRGGSIAAVSISNDVSVTLSRIGSGGGGSSARGSKTSAPKLSVGDISVPYDENGNNVELNIDEATLGKILENSGSTVTFDLDSLPNAASVTVPASVFEALAESGKGSEFKLPAGTINIGPDALASIARQAEGNDISVSISTVDPAGLTPAQRQAAGTGTVYEVSVLSGGRNISDFNGGSLTLTLPYTLKEGETAEGVSIWYLDDDGNLTSISCTYDPYGGTVSCTLTHLSYYVVGYQAQGKDVWINPFTDVSEKDWFYESVAFTVQNGLFAGTSSTTFSPDDNMTRAMLVTVLWRLAGKPGGGQITFADVSGEMWYADAVAWASEKGIVSGYGSGLFGPQDPVTREQLAVIMYNYARSRGQEVSASSDLTSFTDGRKVSPWAKDAVEWAVAKKLITGKGDGSLEPGGMATRAQVATILLQYEKNK